MSRVVLGSTLYERRVPIAVESPTDIQRCLGGFGRHAAKSQKVENI